MRQCCLLQISLVIPPCDHLIILYDHTTDRNISLNISFLRQLNCLFHINLIHLPVFTRHLRFCPLPIYVYIFYFIFPVPYILIIFYPLSYYIFFCILFHFLLHAGILRHSTCALHHAVFFYHSINIILCHSSFFISDPPPSSQSFLS